MAEHLLKENSRGSQVLFICHPKEVSNLRGQRNGNILKLREQFHLEEIAIHILEDIARGILVLQNQKGRFSIRRRDLYHLDAFRVGATSVAQSGREDVTATPF
jgi:hypothetical protein